MAAGDCIKGFIVGGLIGAVLGILYAPKPGAETRKNIAQGFNDLREKTKHS